MPGGGYSYEALCTNGKMAGTQLRMDRYQRNEQQAYDTMKVQKLTSNLGIYFPKVVRVPIP
jgi:hypothetical protein